MKVEYNGNIFDISASSFVYNVICVFKCTSVTLYVGITHVIVHVAEIIKFVLYIIYMYYVPENSHIVDDFCRYYFSFNINCLLYERLSALVDIL